MGGYFGEDGGGRVPSVIGVGASMKLSLQKLWYL